ncbi:MAG: 23S rRNA (guanosine(2251)-2'-O)-methyltransferase RlmB [Bacteroidota bacterium]
MSDPTVVAGRSPVREILDSDPRRIEKVMLARGRGKLEAGIEKLRRAARDADVPVQMVPPQALDRAARGATHQGAVALVAPIAYRDVDALLSEIAPTLDEVKAQAPLVLALDGVEDPHNFGAILRSAVAAGTAAVVVTDRGMAPLSAVAVKASAGAALRAPLGRTSDLAATLAAAKERGYWVVGLEGAPEGDARATTVWDWDWSRATVLVLGREGTGMSRPVREACDALAAIPMRGDVESLNASVAAGIALFIAAKNRD